MIKTTPAIKSILLALFVTLSVTGCGENGPQKLASRGGGGGGGGNPWTTLSVSMTVEFIPTTVEIDRSTSVIDSYEYLWLVEFDMDDDGSLSKGDLMMLLFHEVNVASLPSFASLDSINFKAYLVEALDGVGSWVWRQDLGVSVASDTITLDASYTGSAAVQAISNSTPIRFYTFDQNDGISYAADFYPDDTNFTAIPANGQFTDGPGEPGTNSLTDLLSMTVSFVP